MNKHLILLFAIFAVVAIQAAFAEAQTSYPRTWEDSGWVANNEHIMDLGFFEIWYSVEPTNNISRMDVLGIMLPFHESLEEAELEQLLPECHGIGCNSSSELESALRHKEYADGLLDFVRIGSAASTSHPAYDVAYEWYLMHYVGDWKDAMDCSLRAVEKEGAEVNGRRLAVEATMEEVASSGICESRYSGPANWICYATVDDVRCNSSGLDDSIPDMTWYPACMRTHWETETVLGEKNANMTESWEGAQAKLSELEAYALDSRAQATVLIDLMTATELDGITVSAETSDIGGVASISDEYAIIKKEYENGNKAMGGADTQANSRSDGWYKKKYDSYWVAATYYDDIVVNGALLLEDAEAVVADFGGEAHAALAQAQRSTRLTEAGQAHLVEAEIACNFADAETKLGVRFEQYGSCRMHARLALDGTDIEQAAEYEAAVLEVEKLIQNATTDGIDTRNEQALFTIVKNMKPTDAVEILSRIKSSILGKARVLYGGLPGEREDAKALIEGGGSSFAYMNSWLEREDCYSGNDLDYDCAIGSLKMMHNGYMNIFNATAARAGEVVGNAMLVDYYETTTAASLDEDSEYTLVVRARNTLPMGAENAVISVPAGAEIGKMDLVDGGERVRTVAYQDGVATIQLVQVSAGEEVVLEFKKGYRPCVASGIRTSAVGDAIGGAKVSRQMSLACSMQVNSINVGSGFDSAVLDGTAHAVTDGILKARITKGTHSLGIVEHVADAYGMDKSTELVTTAGTMTTVAYMIDISPKMDLDMVPVWVDESGKSPRSIDVFGYTGEQIKNVKKDGTGVVYFEINGLEADKLAKVRVRYEFSNISSYVGDRIDELEGVNMGGEARALLGNASNLYAAGDYAGALAALQSTESQIEKDAKAAVKVAAKDSELRAEISEKAAELRGAINIGEDNGVGSQYLPEMRARLSVLEGALAQNLSVGATSSPLEDVDLGWEGKEITKIQKYVKDNEAKIKKDWMAIGVDDANLSSAISGLEAQGAVFSGTMTLEDGMLALAALENAQDALDALKVREGAKDAVERSALSNLIAGANSVLSEYEDEYSDLPSGDSMLSLFEKKPNEIKTRLTALNRSTNTDAAMVEAAQLKADMESVLGFLNGEGLRMIASATDLYTESKATLGEDEKQDVENSLEMANDYLDSGRFVKSILASENTISKLNGAESVDNGLLVLALTALLVIGAVALLLFRKGNVWPSGSGRNKPSLRKLKKIEVDEFD
ncbi:MAG: hypothetical protein WC350_02040 [Candidatus Micrarchaeia archaeon]|jgi:putative NIF3 family GTP cyclohydrolase 1 type 2